MSSTFYSLKISDIKRETADTVSIALAVDESHRNHFTFKAGQYLTFKKIIGGEEIRRSYSICSKPSSNEWRVAVKHIKDGKFSSFALNDLKVGDVLDTMPPMGNFKVEPQASNAKNYVFFAAGSGITPILSMVSDILEKENQSKVYLFYVNKTSNDVIFKNELNNLKASYPNFNLQLLYSRENAGDTLMHGRIDKTKCNALHIQILKDVKIDGIYSCGPQEMIMNIKDYFLSAGIPQSNIHIELFTATVDEKAKTESDSAIAVDSEVTVIIDDEPYTFKLNTKGKSILQAAQDAGADVPFSCKGGVCCTCKAKVMDGSAKMDLNYALEPDEVEAGFVLTCQAHPTSSKITVSFDEY